MAVESDDAGDVAGVAVPLQQDGGGALPPQPQDGRGERAAGSGTWPGVREVATLCVLLVLLVRARDVGDRVAPLPVLGAE